MSLHVSVSPLARAGSNARRHSRRVWLAAVISVASLVLPAAARADVVTTWVNVAESVAPVFGGPQVQARALAIVQIAVHDALNSIEPRYERYAYTGATAAAASPDAAVAAAARHALLEQLAPVADSLPKQAALVLIEATFTATVGPPPFNVPTQDGWELGEAAADAILALRANDGSATPHLPYTLSPGPGVYQPTPNPEFPAVITPFFAGWADLTPFAINHNRQFEVEPGRIFDLVGEAYTRNYNEVRSLGDARVRGAAPTSAETDIARFWPGGGARWNFTALVIVTGRGFDRWQHARLFALLNMAVSDSHIANQTWKYEYNFWRPVTAIRWPDDGNPDTPSDPVWRPFLVTPPYPDYPSALSELTGAATGVLREFLGTDDVAFTVTVNAPGLALPSPMAALPPKTITRSFTSLSQASSEAQIARVYAGLHFREACEAGGRQGAQIGKWVAKHQLRPRKGK